MKEDDQTATEPQGPEDTATKKEVVEDQEFKTPEDIEAEEAERALQEAEEADKQAADAGNDDEAAGKKDENQQVLDNATGDSKQDTADGKKAAAGDDEEGEDGKVPTAAVQAERKRRQDAERDNAILRGNLAALNERLGRLEQSNGPGQPENASQPPTPEQHLTDLNARVDKIWDDADNGEISFSEARKKERALESEIRAIEDAQRGDRDTGSRQVVLDTKIEENLQRLESTFPIIKALDETQMQQFVDHAYRDAEAAGEPIRPGALGTVRLHNMAAEAAHKHFGQYYTPAAPAEAGAGGQQGGGKQPQSPGNGSGLSQSAKDREAALARASNHPPNINAVGNGAEGQLSDQQLQAKLEGMGEEEQIQFLDQMPGLAKRLGIPD